MVRGHKAYLAVCWSVLIPLHASAADVPAIVPVVQLTAQSPRPLNREKSFGNILLRELQRQAVLIAARDELGLGTRDMVLREPFVTSGSNGVTTVLFASRILKNDQAEICLSHTSAAPQPVDPVVGSGSLVDQYSLADLQVDSPQNADVQWANFKIPKGPAADYIDFVTQCELASRDSYLKALLDQKVLGTYQANPIKWVADGTPSPADPGALERLSDFNVFSQYLAVRLLHQQIRSSGASVDRVSALVRGYANLGALTADQWSRANKVFLARALLYSQRLVVHENATAASLNARAYARAFTGLHAAALADLDAADTKPDAANQPAWVNIIRGYCRFNPYVLEDVVAAGPWQYHQLASFLDVKVSADKFPADQFTNAINYALATYPGMFVLAPLSPAAADQNITKPADQVINTLPILVRDVLKTASLPTSTRYTARHLIPGDDSFKQIAGLRDQLNAAAAKIPCETNEPSFGVLAGLIEEQDMLAIVHRGITIKTTGAGTLEVQKLASNAMPILKVHPWGPYLDALGVDSNGEDPRIGKMLAKIKDRDPGPWVDDALNHLDNLPSESNSLAKVLRDGAARSADTLVDEFEPNGDAAYLWQLTKTSPYSATLMQAWLRAIPPARRISQTALYDSTMTRVQDDFANRPDVIVAACDWCNTRGDFDLSLKLLQQIDRIEPSTEICNRLARLDRRMGKHDESIAQLMRAVKLTTDPTEIGNTYQQAAVDLIEDHRYDEALACVQQSTDTPTARVWQLMARCYEAMAQLDNADECLRQQAVADPPSISQHYMWAKRLARPDVKEIGRKAQLIFNQPTEFMPEFYMCMAEDQEHKAFDVLRRYRGSMDDAYQFAQLAVLGKKQNQPQSVTDALNAMQGAMNDSFGTAFRSLVQAKDLPAGMAAFEQWVGRQLYDEDAVDWYSLAGRYLVAAGHVEEGKVYLIRAIRQPAHEQQDYYLAWRDLLKIGENPQKLMISPATQG